MIYCELFPELLTYKQKLESAQPGKLGGSIRRDVCWTRRLYIWICGKTCKILSGHDICITYWSLNWKKVEKLKSASAIDQLLRWSVLLPWLKWKYTNLKSFILWDFVSMKIQWNELVQLCHLTQLWMSIYLLSCQICKIKTWRRQI